MTRIALTANGPGEVAGWVRPLLRSLYQREPALEAYCFLVPDEYATGFEAATLRGFFPQAHVYDPKSYVRFALGRSVDDLPAAVDIVQYLGGDLMHAQRVHARLRGRASTYKFSRKNLRDRFDRAFAVDEKNVGELLAWRTPRDRIECVGNLAIDGALLEAEAPLEPGVPEDGILIMPGSRSYEVENLVPFYFAVALQIARERPGVPIAFGLSPFTPYDQVRAAIEGGGHPRIFGARGRLEFIDERPMLVSQDGSVRIPILHHALASAARARLVATIPGTKCIELAALGKPVVTITPFNAPEAVTVNGPLTYLDRIPLIGIPLKRSVALAVAKRFVYHTQPNMDANAALIDEVHSTVTPGRIARRLLSRYDDRAWLEETGTRLAALYRDHVGAADRMAASLLQLAG